MNFTKPAGSVFAHIAKHGSPKQFFPCHSTITQLRQPTQATQNQTDEEDTPSTNNRHRNNTPQRRSYASATRSNTHSTPTPHSISLPSTLPSLQLNPSLTRTPASSAVSLRRATTACDSKFRPTTARLLLDSSDPLHVEPIHPSLPPKPAPEFDLNVYQERVKQAVQSLKKNNAEYFFKEITNRGITPNFATFNLMLNARANWSTGKKAETYKLIQLFDEMAAHYEPDDSCHSAIIHGLSVRLSRLADSVQRAEERESFPASVRRESTPQDSVRVNQEEPESVSLKTEMGALCNIMWEHFQSLSEKSPENVVRIGAALSFQTDVDRMNELRISMPKSAMTTSMICHLIKTYGSANQFDKAKKIFEEAVLIHFSEKSSIADVYKVFADVCLKKGELAEVVKLFDSISGQFPLGGPLQNSIILQCFETGNVSTGETILDGTEQIWPRSTDMVREKSFTNYLCQTLQYAIHHNSMEFASHLISRLLTGNPLTVDLMEQIATPLERYLPLCLDRGMKKTALQTVRLLLQCKITPNPKLVLSLLLSEGKFDKSISIGDVDEILVGITFNLVNPTRYAVEWVPFSENYRSLVKQLADGMIGSRRFALSAARLKPHEADDSWTEFSAEVYNAATEMHPVISQSEYPMALELAARIGDKDEICSIVNTMRNGDLVPPILDAPTYNLVCEAITGKGDLLSLGWWRSNASRLASHAPSFSDPPSLLVADGTCSFEKSERGDKANAFIRSAGVQGDLDTIRIHFHKAIYNLSFGTVHAVFRTFGAKKDFIGAQSIAAMIDKASKRETRSQHREFLTRMSGSGMAIACIFGQEFSTAKKILEHMVNSSGVRPEADVYSYYIAEQKWIDPDSAYKIFQEVLSHKVKPTTYFLNTVLHKFALDRRMDRAFEVFHQFKKNNLKPDDITYGSAINVAARVGNEEVAVGLLSEYLQLKRQHMIRKTSVPFNIIMQYYVGVHKNRDAVVYYWGLLHKEGNEPTRVAYQALLQAYTCLLPVDMNSAETILNQITEPTGSHFAALIFGYGYRLHDFDSANAVLERMLQRIQNLEEVIDPEQAWEALVASYAVHKEIQLAKQARDRMVELMPHLSTLYLDNTLIRGCALFDNDEEEHVGTAQALYDDMDPTLRTPDTYKAMIAVYLKFGQTEQAKKILADMTNREFPYKVTKEAEKLVEESDAKNVQHWVMTNMLRLPALQ